MTSETSIRVVAAVVERDGRLLLGRRPDDKRHGGLWEFPGGKIEPGEDAFAAARRELVEELAIEVLQVGALLLSEKDIDSPFVIEFYPVHVTGDPEPLEHQAVGWFTPEELAMMPLAPADARFVSWYVTREPDAYPAHPPHA